MFIYRRRVLSVLFSSSKRTNRSVSFRLFAPAVILLLAVSALAVLPVARANVTTEAQPVSPLVSPTQLTGFKMTGTLPGATQVFVTIGIPLRNLQSLDYLTEEISTPGSPMYHHFLTQSEISQEFLPTAQYNQALSALEQDGLTIVSTSLDSIIVAEGTSAQVSQNLHLDLESYSNGTSSYYTASGVSTLPRDYVYSSNVTAILLSTPRTLVTTGAESSLASARPSQSNQTAPITSYPLPDLQSVYNATSLYAQGITGKGYTAGILDFFGDPYIAGQLQYFDEVYGLPSADFKVIPIGPYDPSLGVQQGWTTEISLDVESVHTIAPGAAIDLYIGNSADLPLAPYVAAIVQDDKVNDLSQSFGYPEDVFSQEGPSFLDLNVIMTDQYYMLGSAEGITFSAASGDQAGSTTTGQPDGTTGYPGTSPFVTSTGGTSTFLTFNGSNVSSSYQTVWSAATFEPYEAVTFGATGGVSTLEPQPWYQSGLTTPGSFPSGREVPDLSLNSNLYPGVDVVDAGNITYIVGGTSEASPLFAGLLTLAMQEGRTSLGLVNPTLYSLAENPSLYTKVYTPITFGFDTPWVASKGYNLATGWGSPNMGEMAKYLTSSVPNDALSINVSVSDATKDNFEFAPGQQLTVTAVITSGSQAVRSGTFTAELDTLAGAVAAVPLTYKSAASDWQGSVLMPTGAAGLAVMKVTGTSGGVSGLGYADLFAGYVATYVSPSVNFDTLGSLPFSSEYGIPVEVNMTNLQGTPVTTGTFSVTLSSYSIVGNAYTNVATVPLSTSGGSGLWSGTIQGAYPTGPSIIWTNGGAYGYNPLDIGVGLDSSLVEGSTLGGIATAAPGQSIYIFASLQAPENLPAVTSLETGLPISLDVEDGSNVTATLERSSGSVVAKTQLFLNTIISTTQQIQGYINVPQDTKPGLYDVILSSSYDSGTLGTTVSGSSFKQIYVSPSSSVPAISTTPILLFEGQNAMVSAKITYSNDTNVKYGLYMATLYPKDLQNFYPDVTTLVQVPLNYDVGTGLWSANVTLPSAYNSGGTINFDPGTVYYNGPYELYVSGVSADAIPTTTNISAQHQFIIQPYLWVSGQSFQSPPQTSGVAFNNDSITSSVNLAGDVFTGSNIIKGGSVTIVDSQINGTLNVDHGQVTLVGVSGGNIIAQDSKIVLEQSSVDSLTLDSSQVSVSQSSYQQVSPSIPSISVQSPAAGGTFNGTSIDITVNGQNISSVSVFLDGSLLSTQAGSQSTLTIPLSPTSLQDGVHLLKVVALQDDGLSNSTSVYFTTNGQLAAADNEIGTLSTQVTSATASISSLGSQLNSSNGTIGGLDSQLNASNGMISSLSSKVSSDHSTITNLMNWLYILAAIAVVALAVAMVGLFRKGGGSPLPTGGVSGGGESPNPSAGGGDGPGPSSAETPNQPI
jgi:subtilase family serine protease